MGSIHLLTHTYVEMKACRIKQYLRTRKKVNPKINFMQRLKCSSKVI
jgi:hypothetical protein